MLSPAYVAALHRATRSAYAKAGLSAGDEVDPGLLSSAYFWLFEGCVDQTALVHARHCIRILGSARVGDTLVVTGKITDRYEKRGRAYVVVATEVRDGSGALIAETQEHCTWSVPSP